MSPGSLLSWVAVLRRSALLAALAALLLPGLAQARADARELLPGVTYTREVRITPDGPLIVHAVLAPKPGGLYGLKPVLSNDLILGRETVSAMQARLAPQATTVGVNGDLFTWETGRPSGILMRDGVLEGRPNGGRSTLGIGLDGILRVMRIDFFGSWQIGAGKKSPLAHFNRPLDPKENEVGLFTPRWGQTTPRSPDVADVVLQGFPAATPNADLVATVGELRIGGGTPIPTDGAVLQAQGFWIERLLAEALPGQPITVHLTLKPWWENVADAIGGGPVIVRDGQVVVDTSEAFTRQQLNPRHPRTAVGQLADGRILLVVVDGRSRLSRGVQIWELAQELVRLGAATAMALDAGGSTTLAFDGQVLNAPSEGRERPVANALMVFYYGVYAPAPATPLVSPNGDGVGESQTLQYKLVRPATVDARLVAPDGAVVWQEQGPKEPGVYGVAPDAFPQEGVYRWVVSATDDLGQGSTAERTFAVNTTLGHLALSKRWIRVRPKKGGHVGIAFELARPAWVVVTVEDELGRLVRKVSAKRREAGTIELEWDGRNWKDKVVRTGRFTIRVRAANEIGLAELSQRLPVKRVAARG
jgi:hypothetical protein